MKNNKKIILGNMELEDFFVKKYSLENKKDLEKFNIYEKDNLIFCFYNTVFEDFKKIFSYLKDNYICEKFVDISSVKDFFNFDLKPGDVILPNTFLLNNSEKALFLENIIGENYDLMKFGVLLNGICKTLKNGEKVEKNEDYCDIVDGSAYFIFSEFKKFFEKGNLVFIKFIKDDENEAIKNAVNILDLVIE